MSLKFLIGLSTSDRCSTRRVHMLRYVRMSFMLNRRVYNWFFGCGVSDWFAENGWDQFGLHFVVDFAKSERKRRCWKLINKSSKSDSIESRHKGKRRVDHGLYPWDEGIQTQKYGRCVGVILPLCKKGKRKNIQHLVEEERLKEDALQFIERAVSKGYVEYAGGSLDKILPPTSRRHGAREYKKEAVLEKIRKFVDVFVGIWG